MAQIVQYRRLTALMILLVAGFVGLGYRLVDLQWVQAGELRKQAIENTRRTLPREPHRGDIRDRRGHVLATSLLVRTVCADTSLLGPHYLEMAKVLAPLLGTNEAVLAQKLKPRVVRTNEVGELVYDQYVPLKPKVRVEEWDTIQAGLLRATFGMNTNGWARRDPRRVLLRNLRSKAIFTEVVEDQLRQYPNAGLAAHVLGYLGADGNGMDGVEFVMNAQLRGVRGWRQYERDRRGREVVEFRERDIEPRPGQNVFLTLDIGVQHIVESELAAAFEKHRPESVSAVVVQPRTGAVLALATLPGFDPNHPGEAPTALRRNRMIADVWEPGSTFKIVVVAGALNEGLVTLADRFDCEQGRFVFAGKVLRDHERYGVLSVEQVIAKSSNIGAAKVGIQLGPDRLYDYIRRFGFGERSGVPLPGEVVGIVHPVARWSKLSISRIPMGQGIATTPLQMVMAMSAIANGGRLMRPMMIDRVEDETGRVVRYEPQVVRQAIHAPAAAAMVQALKAVVATNGTALSARLDYFTVAGKTGTAQKPGPGGYQEGKYFSSFIGFFPADRPELCISVVFDDPKHGYYGGVVAGPVFKSIAERAANYLNIRPDIEPAGALAGAGPSRPSMLAAGR
jgi:cell division protein FtsI/penicillin-binding protein 2